MKVKTILFSVLILTGLLMSAFGSFSAGQSVPFQDTATPPPVVVTVVPPVVATVIVPATGGDAPNAWWTIVLFGLLGLLGLAFLIALFSPRSTHEHVDRTQPPPDV